MGRFDIDKEYIEGYVPKMIDLCTEIADEIENKVETDRVVTPESVRSRFKAKDKTGIIDRLKRELGYDIEKNAGQDPKQKFEMMQLLKLLYLVEKKGCTSLEGISKHKKGIPISKILGTYDFENIVVANHWLIFDKKEKHKISDHFKAKKLTEDKKYRIRYKTKCVKSVMMKGKYGEYFNDMYYMLSAKIEMPFKTAKRFRAVNHVWESFSDRLFGWVALNDALSYPGIYHMKLCNLYGDILKDIKPFIYKYKSNDLTYKAPVFDTFFHMLCSHFYCCYDNMRLRINNEIVPFTMNNFEYIGNFQSCEFYETSLDGIVEKLNRYLDSKKLEIRELDDETRKALYLISYGKGIQEDEVSVYKYALKNVRKILKWIRTMHPSEENDNIDITLFAMIVQELVHVRKNLDKLKDLSYGHNSNKISLLSIISKDEDMNAIVLYAWDAKLQNRLAVNFGMGLWMAYKRKIENELYEIKNFIFSYKNISDIEILNHAFFNAVLVYSRDWFNEVEKSKAIKNIEQALKEVYE